MGDKAIVNIDFQGIKAAPHVTLRLVVNDAAFAAQKTKLLLLEHSNRATGKNVTWATRLSPSQVVAVRLLASPPPGSASSFKSLKDAAEFFHRNTNSRKAASGVAATGKESGGCCWLSVHALLFNSSSSSLSSAAAPTYMDFIVEFESETAANLAHNTLSAWASATLDIFNGESPRPALTPTPTPAQSIRCIRKVLVLINPFGGKKMAKKIYETGGPAYLFAIAGIQAVVQLTEYAGHAVDFIRDLPGNLADSYDAITTVSGDGLFHEMINGILARNDWKTARNIPIAMIAGGTASAMNKNLETLHPFYAALSIIKGQTSPMDLLSIFQDNKITYSHLNLTWALIADIDIESEKYRWMGEARLIVGALIRLLKLRHYRGSVYYIPYDDEDDGTVPTIANNNINDNNGSNDSLNNNKPIEAFKTPEASVPDLSPIILLSSTSEHHQQQPGSSSPVQMTTTTSNTAAALNSSQSTPTPLPSLLPQTYPTHNGPRLFHLLADYTKWPGKMVDSTFTSFNLCKLAWIAPDFLASPDSKLASGFLDFIYSDENATGTGLLGEFLDLTKGHYLKSKHVHHHHVKALVIIPVGLIEYGKFSSSSTFADLAQACSPRPSQFDHQESTGSLCLPKSGAASSPTSRSARLSSSSSKRKSSAFRANSRVNPNIGIFSLSGEAVTPSPARIEIHPAVMNVLVPDHLDESNWQNLFQMKG